MKKVLHKDGSVMGHKFEASNLGVAPFRFVGVSQNVYQAPGCPPQAGGMCDHCGSGILWECWIEDANKKRFKVGSSCVGYLNSEKLVCVTESALRKLKKQKKDEANAAKAEALWPEYKAALVVLEKLPHPNQYFAAKGKSLADYYRFFEFADGTKAPLGRMLDAIARSNKEGVAQ